MFENLHNSVCTEIEALEKVSKCLSAVFISCLITLSINFQTNFTSV